MDFQMIFSSLNEGFDEYLSTTSFDNVVKDIDDKSSIVYPNYADEINETNRIKIGLIIIQRID